MSSPNPIIFSPLPAGAPPKSSSGDSSTVGAIGAGIQLGTAIGGAIFGAHTRAVANEAATLNAAVPAFYNTLTAIVNAANAGLTTPDAAKSAIDGAVAQYYSNVSSVIKPGNGPDTVGNSWIKPNAEAVKTLLSGSGGSITVATIPAHAGFTGVPTVRFSYKPNTSTPALNPPTPPLPLGATGEPIGTSGVASFSDTANAGIQKASFLPAKPAVNAPPTQEASIFDNIPTPLIIAGVIVSALIAGNSFLGKGKR